MRFFLVCAMGSVFSAFAATSPQATTFNEGSNVSNPMNDVAAVPQNSQVKYKAGKDVNFDELLIQGQLKRPELSVITGNVQPGSDGLLRLREDFTDRIAIDAGEELP